MTAPETDAGTEPVPPRPDARRRTRIYLVAGVVCVLAIGALVWGGLRGNIVYFRTVSEALEERAEGGGTGRFRLAGEFVPGTLRDTGDAVAFDVTDGIATVTVVHRGDQPTMFREGAEKGEEVPLVAEGSWATRADGTAFAADATDVTFESDRLMVKHGNEYQPPDIEQHERT